MANGFSCKTQIADAGTGRHALHTAEVIKMAREHTSSEKVMRRPALSLPQAGEPSQAGWPWGVKPFPAGEAIHSFARQRP